MIIFKAQNFIYIVNLQVKEEELKLKTGLWFCHFAPVRGVMVAVKPEPSTNSNIYAPSVDRFSENNCFICVPAAEKCLMTICQ